MSNQYVLLSRDVCPEVLIKTLEVKKQIELFPNKSITEILKEVDLSRSAFYKYRDKVRQYEKTEHGSVATLYLVLEDLAGTLASIVKTIAGARGNILTINQNVPIAGLADVTISLEMSAMKKDLNTLVAKLKENEGVRRAEILNTEI